VAIALPGPDRLPPGPMRDFVLALHVLYDRAGRPGARVISRGIRQDMSLDETVSHETVSSVLRGMSLPAWAKIHSIIVELARESIDDHDLAELMHNYQPLWLAARTALHARVGPATATQTANSSPTANSTPAATDVSTGPVEEAAADQPEAGSMDVGLAMGGAMAVDIDGDVDDDRVPPPVPAQPVPASRTRSVLPPAIGGRAPIMPAQPPAPGRVIGWLPDRNPFFVGREVLLDTMRTSLADHPNSPLVLYGPGGAGKTQVAREYIGQYADAYSVVWWVPAGGPERARASLLALAERLQVPTKYGAEQTIASLLGRLESRQLGYLIVFDGAEDDDIRSVIPTIGGHVIVTSRNPSLAHDSTSTPLDVPDFNGSEAIQFLRRRDPQLSGSRAESVTHTLGRSPLALEQLAALHEATGESWESLLDRLEEPGRGLLSSGQPSHYPYSVAASMQLATTRLRSAYPPAMLVLELFAWFGPEPVSILLLRAGRAANVPAALARALRDPIQLRKAIGEMCRYGLVRLDADGQRVEIQQLTRIALRDGLDPETQQRARQNVHEILAAADPGLPDDLPSWEMHREMAAHVLPAELVRSTMDAAQRAVVHQIRYRCLIGDFENACVLGEAAVTAWREPAFLGPDHELVLLATRQWANALRACGGYEQSRRLTEDAMRRLEADADFGNDHPQTLSMASGFAADLRIAGEYDRALRLSEETYQRYAAVLDDNDRHRLASHHNLAVSLRLAGRFSDALTVDEEDLDRARTVHGEDHLTTLQAVNSVAEDLYGLGRYREVLQRQLPYLERARQLHSADRVLLLGERTVALAMRGLGQLAESVDSLREHYHSCIESFGPDHEYALAATMSYANALRQRGRAAEAYGHAADAVNAYRRMFGVRNPLTLAAEINLAAIRRAHGELSGARHADSVALEALREVVGDRHPYTIAAIVNLATDLAWAGDRFGALALSEQARDLAIAVRGPHHPDALAATANLAIDRQATGAPDEADLLLTDVLASLRRTYGPEHPIVTQVARGLRVDVEVEPSST
jgi:tetratricopeptide (TPR) repeat protein